MIGPTHKIGITGGTGLYKLPGLKNIREKKVTTPFGTPSAPLVIGTLGSNEVVFLARHGAKHSLLPEEINYRANIYALKKIGVTHVVSVSAVGSLQEHIKPGDMVIADQFFDRTRKDRKDSFFGKGLVVHVAFADPVCPWLRRALLEATKAAGVVAHDGGTYINMEGPAFSTRAESVVYRTLIGASVIGMTNLTEAKLAREAELCYSVLAQVTDYDSWRAHEQGVTISDIIATLQRNNEAGTRILCHLLESFAPPADCACRHALATAVVTPWDAVPRKTLEAVKLLVAPYLPAGKKR